MAAHEIERLIRTVGKECGGMRLYILSLDSTRTLCQTWAGPFDTEAVQSEVYESVEERSLRQANVLGGSHAFLLELVDAQKPPQVLATEFFRVSAEGLPNGAIASEPANEAGKFAQMMRHTETMFRTSLSFIDAGQRMAERAMTKQETRISELESERTEMLKATRDALLNEREHELNVSKAKAKQEMMMVVARQVESLLPEVFSAIATKAAKSPAAAAAIGMKGLFSTLRPEQIGKLLEVLDPEQQLTMVGAMKRLAEADKEAAPNGTTTAIAKH